MLLSENDIDIILFTKFSSVSRQELKLMRSDTLDFCTWYEQFGESWPDSEHFEGYKLYRKQKVGKHPTQIYKAGDKALARVQAVLTAYAREKGEISMVEKEVKQAKGGRKVLDPNGEKRSEKVMLYLTPRLMADVRDLANLNGKSITDYIIGLIEGYIFSDKAQVKVARFRELRDSE